MKTITTVPSTIREIVSSIVLLAHAKGVANEGFVNVDFYIEQLEKEVEKRLEEQRKGCIKQLEKLEERCYWRYWYKKENNPSTDFAAGYERCLNDVLTTLKGKDTNE